MPLDFTPRPDDARSGRALLPRTGRWTDETLGSILGDGFAEAPDQVVSFRSDVRPWRGTYADASTSARRVAGGLQAAGVRPGDPVAFQVPNWLEAAATFYAIAFLGAVPVPIVHFYGAKELGFILRQSGARVLVIADKFGHLDFLGEPRRGPSGRDPRSRRSSSSATTCRATRRRSPRCSTRSRSTVPVPTDPSAPGARRVHVGDDRGPEGRRPLAPHDRLRDQAARRPRTRTRAADARRRTGRSRHRDARRVC